MSITDLEYVERELAQAEDGMSYDLSGIAAKAIREILALPGVSSDGPTAKAVLDTIKDFDREITEAYY